MKSYRDHLIAAVLCLTMLQAASLTAQDGTIPFVDSVEDAAIIQSGSLDFLENALLLGNGDINALVAARLDSIQLRLTKNDVIDARVDTSNDLPPIRKKNCLFELCAASSGTVTIPES